MGHVLASEPPDGGVDARREAERRSSNSWFVGCCYTPRKSIPEGMQTLQMPQSRYKVLSRLPGHFESDTDTESCFSEAYGRWPRRVHFAPGEQEVTVHEWLEDGSEWADARRSDDVDWVNLPEKIERVSRIGLISCLVAPLPHAFVEGGSARRRARLRRQSSKRKSLLATEEASGSGREASAASSAPAGAPKWTRRDLEVWSAEHIKAVTLELFERHDAGRKGRLSWQDREVMAFVQDFFQAHSCPRPDLPDVVFSTAYKQVKVDSLPSHRDVDGLDMAETCEFARRVYDSVVSDPSPEARERRHTSCSLVPVPELEAAEPHRTVASLPSGSAASPRLVRGMGASMVPAV